MARPSPHFWLISGGSKNRQAVAGCDTLAVSPNASGGGPSRLRIWSRVVFSGSTMMPPRPQAKSASQFQSVGRWALLVTHSPNAWADATPLDGFLETLRLICALLRGGRLILHSGRRWRVCQGPWAWVPSPLLGGGQLPKPSRYRWGHDVAAEPGHTDEPVSACRGGGACSPFCCSADAKVVARLRETPLSGGNCRIL